MSTRVIPSLSEESGGWADAMIVHEGRPLSTTELSPAPAVPPARQIPRLTLGMTRHDVDLSLAAERRHLRSPARERWDVVAISGKPSRGAATFAFPRCRRSAASQCSRSTCTPVLTHWATEMPPLRGSGTEARLARTSVVPDHPSAVSSFGMTNHRVVPHG